MKFSLYIFIIGLSILLHCHTTLKSFRVPDNIPDTDLVLVRRFNMEIIQINGEAVSNLDFDFKILPGKYSMTIRPEMHQSSFPDDDKFLEEERKISFYAKGGQTVYLCLGIRDYDKLIHNWLWQPYTIIIFPNDDIRSKFLTALDSQGGCTSPYYTLPYSWITW